MESVKEKLSNLLKWMQINDVDIYSLWLQANLSI